MANCTDVRIDHLDFTTAVGCTVGINVYDPVRAKIYWVYAEQDQTYGGGANNRMHGLYFREYDPVAETFSAAVTIALVAGSATDEYNDIALVRLTSGVLVAVWYRLDFAAAGATQFRIESAESSDNGATWGSFNVLEALDPAEMTPVGFASDGTDVWCYVWIHNHTNAALEYNLYGYHRTAANTWSARQLVYDGTANDGFTWNIKSAKRHALVFGATESIVCLFHQNLAAAPDEYHLACFRTTNGTSWTEIVVRDYGTDTASNVNGLGPILQVDSNGRVWMVYLEHAGGGSYEMAISYSDDNGATWTYGGPIPGVDGGVDGNDFGFAIDAEDRLYVSTFYSNTFRIYSVAAASATAKDWALSHECNYVGDLLAASERCDSFFAGTHYFHEFHNQDTHFQLAFLEEEFPLTPPPTPEPEEAESGADDNNLILEIDLDDPGGWSLRHQSAAYGMDWEEGDEQTGREVPIMLIGNPSIDTRLQTPGLIAVLWRMDDPGSFTKREFVSDGSETHVRQDPLKMRVETKEFTIHENSGLFERNVCRGVWMEYMRDGDPFDVYVWLDEEEKLVQVLTFPNTFGRTSTVFRALKAWGNVAETAKFLIEDESEFPLEIKSIGLVYIRKKGRPVA